MSKRLALSLMILACSVAPAHSTFQARPIPQPEQGGAIAFDTTSVMVGLHLLQRNDVLQHLKLSPSQLSVWKKARPLLFKNYTTTAEVAKARAAAISVRSALTQAQKDRVYQLHLQAVGAFAFSGDEIPKKVGVTAAQKKRMYDVRLAGMRKFQAEMKREGKAYKPDPATTRWIMNGIEAVLTPQQMKKWKALQGKPFTFNPPLRPVK